MRTPDNENGSGAAATASRADAFTPRQRSSAVTTVPNPTPARPITPGPAGVNALAGDELQRIVDAGRNYATAVRNRLNAAQQESGMRLEEIAIAARMPTERLRQCNTGERPWLLPELIRATQAIGAGPLSVLIGDVFEAELALWLQDDGIVCHETDCRTPVGIVSDLPEGPVYCHEHREGQ